MQRLYTSDALLMARAGVLAFVLCLAAAANAMGQGTTATQVVAVATASSSPVSTDLPSTRTFRLAWEQYGENRDGLLKPCPASMRFAKEPDFGSRPIRRGYLPTGPAEADWIGFAFDQESYKLHLDLNRNRDLTDDGSSGTVATTYAPPEFQAFDFDLVTTSADVPRRYNCNMCFYPGRARISVSSTWDGHIEIGGRIWRAAVHDNLDGVIDTQDWIALKPTRLASCRKWSDWSYYDLRPAADRLFLADRLYTAAYAFERGTSGTELLLTLAPIPATTGEMKLPGTAIESLLLDGPGAMSVHLASPGSTVSLPVGDYQCRYATLYGGLELEATEAWREHNRVHVSTTESAVLRLGGPVDIVATATAYWNRVDLLLGLQGIGGEEYGPVLGNRPEVGFNVMQRGREVARLRSGFG